MLQALATTLLAGLFSYLALVISKENKISEFRQKWIDELREELADFFTSVKLVHYKRMILSSKHKGPSPPEEQEKYISEPYKLGLVAFNKVLLRLNPEGKKNAKSIALIKEMKVIQDFSGNNDFESASNHLEKVREVAQDLLRSEWHRVKKGEFVFYYSRVAFPIIAVISAVLLAYLAYDAPAVQTRTTVQGLLKVENIKEVQQAPNATLQPPSTAQLTLQIENLKKTDQAPNPIALPASTAQSPQQSENAKATSVTSSPSN